MRLHPEDRKFVTWPVTAPTETILELRIRDGAAWVPLTRVAGAAKSLLAGPEFVGVPAVGQVNLLARHNFWSIRATDSPEVILAHGVITSTRYGTQIV